MDWREKLDQLWPETGGGDRGPSVTTGGGGWDRSGMKC